MALLVPSLAQPNDAPRRPQLLERGDSPRRFDEFRRHHHDRHGVVLGSHSLRDYDFSMIARSRFSNLVFATLIGLALTACDRNGDNLLDLRVVPAARLN